MKSLISLSFVTMLGLSLAQEVRITNNRYKDYTSPNNAFSIIANPSHVSGAIHIVYYTNSVNGQTYEVVHVRSTDFGYTWESTVISDATDTDNEMTPSIAINFSETQHLNIAYYDEAYNPEIAENDEAIWARRSTNAGAEWLDRFRIRPSPTENFYDYNPSNAIGEYWDPGNYLTHYVWKEENELEKIMYQRYLVPSAGGSPGGTWLGYFELFSGEEAYPELPSVATCGNYVYIVAQADDEIGNTQIYFKRNTYYGEPYNWETERIISENMPSNGYSENPSIAVCEQYVYVVWEQYFYYEGSWVPTVYFRRNTNYGDPNSWESPIPMRGPGAPPPTRQGAIPVYEFGYTPVIGTYGEYVSICWQWGWGPISGAGEYTIMSAKSTDYGVTWPASQIEKIGGYWPHCTEPEMNPSVSAEFDLHITWTDARWSNPHIYPPDNPEIYYKRIPFYYTKSSSGGGQNGQKSSVTFGIMEIKPNPCSEFTKISFQTPNSHSTLKIYDVTGKLVKTLWQGDGKGKVLWDSKDSNGRKVKSGTYFLTLESGNYKKIAKVIVR